MPFYNKRRLILIKMDDRFISVDNIPSGRYSNSVTKMRQSEQTKNAILDAANRVLVQAGAESFTLEAVALEANVSKGGLLYHFASKNALISGMIARSIERIDATLSEEIERANGDYLTAYIRASFRTMADPEQVSRAIQAAIVRDPALLNPLRERFERIQLEMMQRAPTPALGLLVRLSMDGMWFSEQYQFAPPDSSQREELQSLLMKIVRDQTARTGGIE